MNKSKMLQAIYQTISASFCVIVVISNILSAKMVALPLLAITIPAGLITYPLTFLLTDLVTEIFGARRAKLMVYIALAMSFLSFGMIQVALLLPESEQARISLTDSSKDGRLVGPNSLPIARAHCTTDKARAIGSEDGSTDRSDLPSMCEKSGLDEQKAFQVVLGLSGLRIFSSLLSYIISQLVDIQLYAAIKQWTGPKFLWLRNNGSTCVSQIVDTIMIDLIFLWWGLGMTIIEVFPIMLFSYAYKAFFSVACTPIFYLLVFLIRGKWKSKRRVFPLTSAIETKGLAL